MTDIKIGDYVKFKEGSTIIPNDNVYKVVMASRSYAGIFIPEVETVVAIDINRLEPVNKNKRGQNDNNPNETTD